MSTARAFLPNKARAAKTQGLYAVHPGVAQIRKWIEELPQKTGRSIEEWITLTKTAGPPTEKERIDWLKKEHKLGTIRRRGLRGVWKARTRKKSRRRLIWRPLPGGWRRSIRGAGGAASAV